MLAQMPYSVFQFHKGTIKALLQANPRDDNQTFNSIKVQLRQQVYCSYYV